MYKLIILGSGLAGYSLARDFRRLDSASRVLLITADDGCNYSKPMLSNAFAQNKTAEQLVMSSAEKMAESLNIEIRTETWIERIDAAQQQVWAVEESFTYENLVLAVGAQPIRLPIAGDAADEVLSVNNLQDYAAFRERVDPVSRVAILGPGLIGCEFANDLLNAGKQVHIIGPDSHPLGNLIPAPVGQALQAALSEQGVQWHLGTVLKSVNKSGAGYALSLADGTELEVDVVLSAVGLRPSLQLAEAAGLQTQRGIVTDAYLQTSDAHIYALGDCAEVEGRNLPYIAPLMHGAKALAKTLSGEPTAVAYPMMPVMVKTPAHPLTIVPAPPQAEGAWRYEIEAAGVAAFYEDASGQLLGFALSGDATQQKQTLLKQMSQP